MTPVAVPRVPRPEVSVLVPVYGQEEIVLGALDALARNTPPIYELIVVDNASPGGLGERLAAGIENARVIRNTENRGFGGGCNQAADLATARVLVFLNSDAFGHPGWLPPLLGALSRERTGAAAPRVLNQDGTLQEAGCLVFANAHTRFNGLGDDPRRSEYRFPRRVDYASAVCLAVKRRAFHDAGGFDPAFGLGYCEDVDLCLRLRQNGLDTVYEPASVVMHLRGASSKPGEALALWSRNVQILFERWKGRLSPRPASPGEEPEPAWRRAAARDGPAALRVLVVDRPAGRSAETPRSHDRTLWLAWSLSTRWPGVQTTLLTDREAPGGFDELRHLGIEVVDGIWDPMPWFADRRYHDDVVILRTDEAHLFAATALERYQPQAALVLDSSTAPSSGPGPAIAAGGGGRRVDAVFAADLPSRRLARLQAPSVPVSLVPTGQDSALDDALASVGVPPDSP